MCHGGVSLGTSRAGGCPVTSPCWLSMSQQRGDRLLQALGDCWSQRCLVQGGRPPAAHRRKEQGGARSRPRHPLRACRTWGQHTSRGTVSMHEQAALPPRRRGSPAKGENFTHRRHSKQNTAGQVGLAGGHQARDKPFMVYRLGTPRCTPATTWADVSRCGAGGGPGAVCSTRGTKAAVTCRAGCVLPGR